jgi:hypothetical protein
MATSKRLLRGGDDPTNTADPLPPSDSGEEDALPVARGDDVEVRHVTSLADLCDGQYWLGLRETETSPALFLWEIEIRNGRYKPNEV